MHNPPQALGAAWDGNGVAFALYSEHAERVELCLFEPDGEHERTRIDLERGSGFVWHAYVAGAGPGTLYAYRVHGPAGPRHRFDPQRLLLDPYARKLSGDLPGGRGRCVVVEGAFDWGGDRAPRTPWEDTVLYEAHVKGFTRRYPGVPESERGTYAGLACAAAIDHLKKLGVTAIELLPIHAFVDEPRLRELGLRNYWGYNSIGYFAPEPRYGLGDPVSEFKSMVKALHAAGLEVILDVVYNHTGEGDHDGPTLSFRGIDNAVYYRLDPEDPARYLNFTGTGNTLNVHHPAVLRLVMDSLRYWATEMRVDGFRFDLAPVLARTEYGFDPRSPFLQAVYQDPVLSKTKLIAEPWDLGEFGYRLGQFPSGWAEWNDKYRDAARSYWKGDPGALGHLASRLAGSWDLFGAARGPVASVNFVTAHDGFTLRDLVSYERKHNEANGEDNRDGANDNISANYGVEGSSNEPSAVSVRERQKRNLLATLLLSRGTPMLLAGDELGRTQQGNNNAYCQDNELSWLDWARAEPELVEFTARAIALRRRFRAFRKSAFTHDIVWLSRQGGGMTEADWHGGGRCVGALFGEEGLLLLLNAHDGEIAFALPAGSWTVLLDTAGESPIGPIYLVKARSLCLLQRS